MKLLRLKVNGLPLFENELDISFYATQRVNEEDRESLFKIANFYLNPTTTFIGLNASGKTSVLKVIDLSLNILRNEPINHIESKSILLGSPRVDFNFYYLDKRNYVCLLKTSLVSRKDSLNNYIYSILEESFYEKPLSSIRLKKDLTDFSKNLPTLTRKKEDYLLDDVSFIVALNKRNNENIKIYNLSSFTSANSLSYIEDIPMEVVSFLDSSIESIKFITSQEKRYIKLKFKEKEEITLNRVSDLEQYLSSGTIKGIIMFNLVSNVLKDGGYLLVDELENHFNKEIVATIIRFFLDSRLNINGGSLIFTTHYPELLDIYNRNDSIYILRNNNLISSEPISSILKRNDIKKSDAYQSGLLRGTTPSFRAYSALRRKLYSETAKRE